jgi:PhzF family phenazine biosynthesis protein
MQSVELHVLDAFTRTLFGGNVAAIVSQAGDLGETEMQIVAREVAASVTGFLVPAGEADFGVRFFTPMQEIDMCGHGLVALCRRLVDMGKVELQAAATVEKTIWTKAGVVPVIISPEGDFPLVMMGQAPPVFRSGDLDRDALYQALGLRAEQVAPDLPLEFASAALEHLFVPVRDRAALAGLQPDFSLLTQISNEIGVVSIAVLTLDTADPAATVRCRDFCPAAGIPEAAGSGTTNSALLCYLVRNGALSWPQGSVLRTQAEQGCEMKRPARIYCQARLQDGEIRDLYVGGTAIVSIEGRINLPSKE